MIFAVANRKNPENSPDPSENEGGKNKYSTWVEIDLRAIEVNVQRIIQLTNTQVMAVVKANGYGHGDVQTARAALKGGATWCAVARIDEALNLRNNGLLCPILVMGHTPPRRYPEAIGNDISLTVWDHAQIVQASSSATQLHKNAMLHLKIDTGMGRLGIQPEKALDFAQSIRELPKVKLEGLYTHFARADEPDVVLNKEQEDRFTKVLHDLEAQNLRPAIIHAANSAASITRPSARFDILRIGIAMYGLSPLATLPDYPVLEPALSWKSILTQVKVLPPGSGVSYGHDYVTTIYEHIGTIPVGYADGYRRSPGCLVLIRGKRAPVIGRVCMDQIMVRLDAVPEAQTGDEVILIGSQQGDTISAEEIAEHWGTINYEVVCGISSRVPRIYLPDPL